MKNALETVWWVGIYGIMAMFLALQFWLFYFADCQQVKDSWWFVHVPGRCISGDNY